MMHRMSWMTGALAVPVIFFALALTAFAQTNFETKTKVRLVEKGVWLETEIAPPALLAAIPHIDENADGRLDEDELSAHRVAILTYYVQRVKLAANARPLTADSTYFAFRSPATASAMPDRFYIYHWFAMLRRPQQLQVDNRLFCELAQGCAHQGAVIDGGKIFTFEFPARDAQAGAKPGLPVLFEVGKAGEVTLVESGGDVLQAGYLWLGLGLTGLLALRMASSVRRKLRRRMQPAKAEPQEMQLEESAVFGRAKVKMAP